MEPSNHRHFDGSCCKSTSGDSVRQTLSELDFVRGIWYAAQSNDLDRVKLLISKGSSPDEEDAAGYSALHYAARNGHERICRELLQQGANVNAVTKSGRVTSLHRAATQKHVNIVELLLSAGANADLQDSDGFTALHRAIMSECDQISKLLITRTNLNLIDKFGCNARQLSKKRGREYLFL